MSGSREIDHIISEGTIRCGEFRVSYYTTNPTPSQWMAIGVLFTSHPDLALTLASRLIVGNGACERSATADLQNAFARTLARNHQSCEIASEMIANEPVTLTDESSTRV
ncbi:MAG: hypothetical protein EA415_03490 [Sphaerobacteraceae bacterium]|nr:MAG: hypothetical protein EA415_03490 [Sphaerobacteraceae bacterium]